MSLISGSATFGDGSVNCSADPTIIKGPALFVGSAVNYGDISSGYFSNPDAVNCGSIQVAQFSSGSTNCAVVSCASFFDNSSNVGTISLTAAFSGTSVNSGTALNASFFDSTANLGTIQNAASFSDTTVNSGVAQVASFVGSASNVGTISGTATFADTTRNLGYVEEASFTGSASNIGSTNISSFAGTSTNCGGVTTASFFGSTANYGEIGTATFADTTVNSGAIGAGFFVGSASNAGTVDTVAIFDDSASNVGIINCAYFSGTSSNAGTICCASFSESTTNLGTICTLAEFIGSASNVGVINGDVFFSDTSSNAGVVLGNADFASGTCNAGSVSGTVYAASGAVICLTLTYVDITGYSARIGAYDLIANGLGQCFTGNFNYVNSGALIYDDATCCSYVSDGTGYYISYYRTGTCLTNQTCFEIINSEPYPCGFVNIYSNGLGGCYCLTNLPIIIQQPLSILPETGLSNIQVVEFQEFAINLSASGDDLNYKWYNNNNEEIIDNTDGWSGANTSYLAQFSAQAVGWYDCYYALVYNEAGGVRSCRFLVESTVGAGNWYDDTSSVVHTVTLNGSVTQVDESGGVKAAQFDGSTGYLNTTASGSEFDLSSGDSTIEFWFKPTTATYGVIVYGGAVNTITVHMYSDGKLWINNGAAEDLKIPVMVGVWQHVAIVISSGSKYAYLNGFLAETSNQLFGAASQIYIGKNNQEGHFFDGSIAGLRIVKGSAIYTSDFSVATSLLTAVTGTQLLLNFGATAVPTITIQDDIFTDASIDEAYNITLYSYTTHGGLFYQDGVPYTGTHSVTDYEIQSDEYGPYSYTTTSRNIAFENGVEFLSRYGSFTSDQNYISSNSSISIGTGDFTFEGFLKPSQLKSNPYDTSFINGVGYAGPCFYVHYDYSMHFGPNGVGSTITSTAGHVELNKWHHVAIVRENGLLSIYINGVRKNTASDSFDYGNHYFEFSNSNSLYGFVGSMAYIRISNNARYSGASFSIPTASFTSDANTLKLALNSTTLESGLTNHGVTLVGIS